MALVPHLRPAEKCCSKRSLLERALSFQSYPLTPLDFEGGRLKQER
jgi:hypothetical protein